MEDESNIFAPMDILEPKGISMVNAKHAFGLGPRGEGNQFEKLFEKIARLNGVGILNIPEGVIRAGTGFFSVKTPCDWLLAKDGKACLIDTKTTEKSRFDSSKIKPHQVETMITMTYHGLTGGYVVYFRSQNVVVFYPCKTLHNFPENMSLGPEDGIELGPIAQVDLRPLFADYT